VTRTVPTADAWLKKYRARVATSGQEWVDKTLAATGVAAAAKSDAAEATWAAKMTDAVSRKARQRGLASVTDEDIKNPIRAGGAGLWTTPTTAKAEKAGRKVAPYLEVIRAVLPTLPAKTADGLANLNARAGPIVQALQAKKRSGV